MSPDGKFMWSGAEWIPAPPSEEQISVNDTVVMGDLNVNDGETISDAVKSVHQCTSCGSMGVTQVACKECKTLIYCNICEEDFNKEVNKSISELPEYSDDYHENMELEKKFEKRCLKCKQNVIISENRKCFHCGLYCRKQHHYMFTDERKNEDGTYRRPRGESRWIEDPLCLDCEQNFNFEVKPANANQTMIITEKKRVPLEDSRTPKKILDGKKSRNETDTERYNRMLKEKEEGSYVRGGYKYNSTNYALCCSIKMYEKWKEWDLEGYKLCEINSWGEVEYFGIKDAFAGLLMHHPTI